MVELYNMNIVVIVRIHYTRVDILNLFDEKILKFCYKFQFRKLKYKQRIWVCGRKRQILVIANKHKYIDVLI